LEIATIDQRIELAAPFPKSFDSRVGMTAFYKIIPFLGIPAAPFKKANIQIGYL